MNPVTKEQFLARARDHNYYHGNGEIVWNGRASTCCDMIRKVPGSNSRVLEVGAYQTPLVNGCAIMDKAKTNLHCPGFRHVCHDAGNIPWPFQDGEFDLVIACAVWEHLGRNESMAWREVMRISDWALFAVPFRWTNTDPSHANIDLPKIGLWTCGFIPYEAIVTGSVYIGLYDMRPYKKLF